MRVRWFSSNIFYSVIDEAHDSNLKEFNVVEYVSIFVIFSI